MVDGRVYLDAENIQLAIHFDYHSGGAHTYIYIDNTTLPTSNVQAEDAPVMMVSLLILILIRETLCPAFSPSIQNHHCRLDWVKVLRKVSFLEHALIESLNFYTLLNRRKYVVVVGGPVGTMDDVPLLSLGNYNYFYFGNLIESFYT